MIRCEDFAGQVRNPVTEFFVTCRDKAAKLAVEGMSYVDMGIAAVAVFGEVWGI